MPLSDEAFRIELEYINCTAYKFGYPDHIIKGIFERIKAKHLQDLAYKTGNITDVCNIDRYHSVKYFDDPYLLNKMVKIYKRHNHLLGFNNVTIADHLRTSLERIDVKSQSGVYKISCRDCDAIYIGETGRQVATRVKEHVRDYVKSNMGRHLLAYNHKLDEDKVVILHKTKKGPLQMCWETYEIYKCIKSNNVRCLNDKIQANLNPLYRPFI